MKTTEEFIQALPSSVVSALKKYGPDLILAGGFFRAVQNGEPVRDFDLWPTSPKIGAAVESDLRALFGAPIETERAVTFKLSPPVQVIRRYSPNAKALLRTFDFTISKMSLLWDGAWIMFGFEYWKDHVPAKRLNYTNPAGNNSLGSMARLIRFSQMGYRAEPYSVIELIRQCAAQIAEMEDCDAEEIIVQGGWSFTPEDFKAQGGTIPADLDGGEF